KVPAVLCLHGTNNAVGHGIVVGLGGTPNRAYAIELAQRGYVTLAPNYPLLAKYQPDLKKLGWESGTLKAVRDNRRGLDLLAPRHVLIIAPRKDSDFRADSVDRIAAAARPVFKRLGHEGRLMVEHPDCGHIFPPEMREKAYKLFDAVLAGKEPS